MSLLSKCGTKVLLLNVSSRPETTTSPKKTQYKLIYKILRQTQLIKIAKNSYVVAVHVWYKGTAF